MKKSLLILAVTAAMVPAAQSAVHLTTGAGYIPLAKSLVSSCRTALSAPATESYGGAIGAMLAQVQAGSAVNVVLTDRGTLTSLKSPVVFSQIEPLGTTPLVLVWRKGLTINTPADLAEQMVARIAAPDARAAVYGRAAHAWLEAQDSPLRSALSAKWLEMGHVPQVISYVSRGEVDAGFVNVLAARKNRDALGGMMVLRDGYPKIEMVLAVVQGHEQDPDVKALLACARSPEAGAVLERSGIER